VDPTLVYETLGASATVLVAPARKPHVELPGQQQTEPQHLLSSIQTSIIVGSRRH